MNIASYRAVKVADVGSAPKDATWADDLLDSRDAQLADLTRAIQGRLSPHDNLNAEYRDVSVLHDTEFDFTLRKAKGQCAGVLLVWSSLYDYAQVAWRQVDASRIAVKISFDSAPTDHVDVRLLVLGA